MTGMWLSPQALELEPNALAKLIVDTAASAAQKASDQQDLLINELNHRMRTVREAPLTLWDGSKIDALATAYLSPHKSARQVYEGNWASQPLALAILLVPHRYTVYPVKEDWRAPQ